MRRLTIFFAIVFSVALDCSRVPHDCRSYGCSLPDAVRHGVFGRVYGRMSGALSGLCAGVLMDLLFAPVRGFYALIYLVTGYMAGAVCDRGMQQTPLAFGVFLWGVRKTYYTGDHHGGDGPICWRAAGQCTILLIRFILPTADDRRVGHPGIFGIAIAFWTSGHGRAASYTGLD